MHVFVYGRLTEKSTQEFASSPYTTHPYRIQPGLQNVTFQVS